MLLNDFFWRVLIECLRTWFAITSIWYRLSSIGVVLRKNSYSFLWRTHALKFCWQQEVVHGCKGPFQLCIPKQMIKIFAFDKRRQDNLIQNRDTGLQLCINLWSKHTRGIRTAAWKCCDKMKELDLQGLYKYCFWMRLSHGPIMLPLNCMSIDLYTATQSMLWDQAIAFPGKTTWQKHRQTGM